MIFGFLRFFAIIGLALIYQNFSRKKVYQITIITGINTRNIGYTSVIMDYEWSFLDRARCIDAIVFSSGAFPENSICSSCCIILMSSLSVVYVFISAGI